MKRLVMCLAACALAQGARLGQRAASRGAQNGTVLGGGSVESHPMFMYKKDCGKKLPVLLSTAVNAQSAVSLFPGAGMEQASIVPFSTVLKDGFYHVDCIKDYMFYFGDKFGDNHFGYKLGNVANVSIVLYDQIIPKHERQPMSQTVCFAFCRTVPDMVFFGLQNGRSCYCSPYFRAMESDGTQCESMCEGDVTSACGGKTKSSIFEMHMCQQTAQDLGNTQGDMKDMSQNLGAADLKLRWVATEMKKVSETIQQEYGALGDSAASALAQAAKVRAGQLLEMVDAAEELADEIVELDGKAKTLLPSVDPGALSMSAAGEAELLMADMHEATAKADLQAQEMSKVFIDANPDMLNLSIENVTEVYKDVMHFVDKAYVGVPSTCAGALLGDPSFATMTGCAEACEHSFSTCVGFSWFDSHVCFLFSELRAATYYTGCKAFLQTPAVPAQTTTCMVKFSKFVGTSLKPDPSGKCSGCLSQATKADRCPGATIAEPANGL